MVMSRVWTLPLVWCLSFAPALIAPLAMADAQPQLQPHLQPHMGQPYLGQPYQRLDIVGSLGGMEMEPLMPQGSAAPKYRTTFDSQATAALALRDGLGAPGGALSVNSPIRSGEDLSEDASVQHISQSVVWLSMVCLGIMVLAGFNSRKPRPRYLSDELQRQRLEHGNHLARAPSSSWDDR